jgi:hypothetical protein
MIGISTSVESREERTKKNTYFQFDLVGTDNITENSMERERWGVENNFTSSSSDEDK